MQRRAAVLLAAVALGSSVVSPAVGAEPSSRNADRSSGWREIQQLPSRAPLGLGDSVPLGTIGIRSSIGYVGDLFVVVGEVWNRTSTRREFIKVEAGMYEGANLVGTIDEFVYVEQLAPGSISPFVLFTEGWPALDGYSVKVSGNGTAITAPPVGVLDFYTEPVVIDVGAETRTYNGVINNPTNRNIGAWVLLTTYDSNGDVLDAGFDGPINMSASSGTGFSIELFYDPGLPVDHISVTADARDQTDNSYLASLDNYFNDLHNTSFRNDILWMYEEGITKGCAPARFCPDAAVARDQMASFLSRALNLPSTPTDFFTDDETNSHETNINRMAAAGITAGCAPGLYCPTAVVKRDQMASFLARAFELPATGTDYFTDDEGNTHEANINRLRASGITTGCSAVLYCPAASVTRGQMAAFLHRALEE